MEAVVIAITGTITAIGVLYKTYVELTKRQLDSSDVNKKTGLDEFSQLLKGYKDLKDEYEEQVKQLRVENIELKGEISKLRGIMTQYEERLRAFEQNQKNIKQEITES